MFEQLVTLRGWTFDVAMVLLIVVSVLVTHSLFKLGDWLTHVWRGSTDRKGVGTPDITRVRR